MEAAALLPPLIRAARSGPGAVLEALERPLRELGFDRRRTRGEPLAELWTRGAPKLALSGHVDVVPVGEGWARDPFGGELAEGRIWGRGACDMLGAVAAFVGAATLARDAPCAILLTTDEETGMAAAERALDEGLLGGLAGVVVGEPTDLAIGVAEKGVMWTRVRTSGRNAHGSMPHLGDNAADRLVRVLAELQRVELPGTHPLLGSPTRSLGILRAGEAVNQVPASASAEVDFRYLPGGAPEDLLQLVRDAAARVGEHVEIEVLSNHLPFEARADEALVRAARYALPSSAALGLPYGTEASKYAPRGIPCVILGPGDPALAHTNREHVLLDSLWRAEQAYALMLRSYAERDA